MRILIINQFFWPDTAATSQFLTDLTCHLGREHDVTVICSAGTYARSECEGTAPPAKVIHVPGLKYGRDKVARMISYSTFLLGALWHEFRMPRQDVVVTMTTPPMLSVCGTILKVTRGTHHFIWEMDVFPDVLVSLGVLSPNGFITRMLTWLENACHLRSDGIIALGSCMRERLVARGIPRDLVHVVNNWADSGAILPTAVNHLGPLNILYSGNLGLSHEIDAIAGAIRRFKNDPRFRFTFAGGGSGRAALDRLCHLEGTENVHFAPYASRDRLSQHLGHASIGLVTQKTASIGTVVPSKIYGLMAAARPILFVGPRQSTPDLMIRRFECGWQIDPGDTESLVTLLERLYANREEIDLAGRRARLALELHYDMPDGLAQVAEVLGLTVLRRLDAVPLQRPPSSLVGT